MAKTISLTELGKSKSEVSSDVQGLRYAIINYIESHGESTLAEIADGTNTNQTEIRMKVNQLAKERWILWNDNGDDDGEWGMN